MKLKVLHIITRLDKGGSATNTIETVARLNKDLYQTTLLSGYTNDPDGAIEEGLKQKGIQCTYLPDLRRAINPFFDIKAFCKLYSFIKKGNFDIVHTHSSKAGILGRWAAWLNRTRYIIHTPHGHVFYGYFNRLISRAFIIAEQLTGTITTKIITLTEKGKEEHLAYKIAPENKFICIYSGIEIDMFTKRVKDPKEMRRTFGLSDDMFIFGSVARLDPIKNNQLLVRAIARVAKIHPQVRLILIGAGEERKTIEQLIASFGLQDTVLLAGFRDDIPDLLGMFDVFVLASLNEGMGRVILEGMAAGRPVIATQTGGISELVVENKTGLLVPVDDVNAFAEAMLFFVEHQSIARQYGKCGKELVTDKFSIEKMIVSIEKLYAELVGEKK